MARVINRTKLDLPAIDQTKITDLIKKWENTQGQGAELADFQSFTRDLCDALNLPHPDPKSDIDKGAAYIFERPVDSYDSDGQLKSGKNRIDLYKRDCFVLEGKQTGKKIGTHGWNTAMKKAFHQADNYVRTLPENEGRPPFIVVIDVGRSIQLYSEFSCSGGLYQHYPNTGNFTITLEDIAKEEIQQRLQTLWLDPHALDESKYAAEVTREVSTKLAELAKSLEQAGFEVGRTAHFIKRCLFTMFSEDVDLIPEGSFTQLLEDLKQTPEHFVDSMTSLWNTMNTGGFEGQLRTKLRKFNGGLFKGIDPIPLNTDQIQLLIDAAKADWRYVEPAIFGTLLERALDPRERHKLGAHYTPRAYVERLVMPTLIEPLRKKWDSAQVEVEIILQGDAKNCEDNARTVLRDFHKHLCEIKILDPACGSANFLYVALEHLKRLEGEVLNAIRDLSGGQVSLDSEGFTVDPHQFLGIEVNPRAAAIAEIVLWIGYLQWHYRIHGKLDLPDPILRDFKNIENRDALIDYDGKEELLDENGEAVTTWDGISYKTSAATGERVPDEIQRIPAYKYINPRKTLWPEADYIIGNPPYLGARTIRLALGDSYLQALRGAYSEIPQNADFVMYWWHIAAEFVGAKNTERLGLITTNSLRQSFCRRVVENSLASFPTLTIVSVFPDHPWVDSSDGAAVRVSLITAATKVTEGCVFRVIEEKESENGYDIIFEKNVGYVTPNLNIGADPAGAKLLSANTGVSSVGYQLTGRGFILDEKQKELFPSNYLGGIIRPLLSGSDITRSPRELFSIDVCNLSLDELKCHSNIYQWLLERVKPERDQNNRKSLREKWWVYGESRNTFRPALKNIEHVYTTSLTAKHRLFKKVPSNTIADSTTVMFAFNSIAHMGVISSRIHICWAQVAGGTLEDRPRYNKNVCFETFPFPELTDQQKNIIRDAAEKIDQHRKNQQAQHSQLTLTNIYNVLEKLRKEEILDKKEQLINHQGLVTILQELHDELDRQVFAAYGWQDLAEVLVGKAGATTPLADKSDEQSQAEEELLSRLVALNHERATEEKAGKIRWLRSDYQNSDAKVEEQPEQTDMALADTTPQKENNKKHVKDTWPKVLTEQISAVIEILNSPMTCDQVAENFKRKPIKPVLAVLEALETLGRAQRVDDKWELTY